MISKRNDIDLERIKIIEEAVKKYILEKSLEENKKDDYDTELAKALKLSEESFKASQKNHKAVKVVSSSSKDISYNLDVADFY